MISANYRVRRATLDDLEPLMALWSSMQYPVEILAKRVTEFQVAEGPEGQVLGAVGLQILQRQGCIHSEGFTDFGLAEHLRPLLWERLQSVATNHGLLRLWTQEQAPFWNHCGLAKADNEALESLPAAWRNDASAWLTVKLKEDLEEIISADREFAVFMQSERQRSARTLQKARLLKGLATFIAFAVLILAIVGAVFLAWKNPHLLHR
ncbi:MAG TPA: hypothetical protein VNT26_23830 [Candidatus Sulfotelmatobacter sp.]|nr:hypothetical protein [Candidatus Sulfotelmatobacter sp.]HWI58251.1 hypothetical protein [Bacillota bacterium]